MVCIGTLVTRWKRICLENQCKSAHKCSEEVFTLSICPISIRVPYCTYMPAQPLGRLTWNDSTKRMVSIASRSIKMVLANASCSSVEIKQILLVFEYQCCKFLLPGRLGLPVLGQGYLFPEAGSPGGRQKKTISQLRFVPQSSVTTQFAVEMVK